MFKNKTWMVILIVIVIIYLAVLTYNRINMRPFHEGFSQKEAFVVKRDEEIYDPFYVEIYDRLALPEKRGNYELDAIVANTQASPKSAFLEIGSGTGSFVHLLKRRGYEAYGIDKSRAMVDISLEKYPGLSIKCEDANDPLAFEKGTFSHILCMYFTIYQFPDKVAFFRNCYHWLMNNSYLILHVVDPDKYDTIVPGGKPETELNIQEYAKTRVTNTEIDFVDFYYTSAVNMQPQTDIVIITEKFTDRLSKAVRQNEQTLYMEPVKKILEMARFCGFVVHGKMDYKECSGDSYQYLYFLEKLM